MPQATRDADQAPEPSGRRKKKMKPSYDGNSLVRLLLLLGTFEDEDPAIVVDLVRENPDCIPLVLAAIKKGCPEALTFADKKVKENQDIAFAVVTMDGLALQYLSSKLRNDLDVVTAAIMENPHALAYASKEQRNNPEIVGAAVGKCGMALMYAGPDVLNDSDVVKRAVEHSPRALSWAGVDARKNAEIVLLAVRQEGTCIQYAEPTMRANPEVALAAVAQDLASIEFVHPNLITDREFITKALQQNWRLLQYLPSDARANFEYAMTAAIEDVAALDFASAETRKNVTRALMGSVATGFCSACQALSNRLTMCLPCGHMTVCEGCANEMEARVPRTCPVCRCPVEMFKKALA